MSLMKTPKDVHQQTFITHFGPEQLLGAAGTKLINPRRRFAPTAHIHLPTLLPVMQLHKGTT